MGKLIRILVLMCILAGAFMLLVPGIPIGTKQGLAKSGNLTFPYSVAQRLRVTTQGPQLQLDMTSAELVEFVYAEFATTNIHRKIRDQQVEDIVFTSEDTARITGRATLRLNKYIKSTLRFTADMKIEHDDRALLVTYSFDFKDFPDALERDITRRIPMDKRLRRDCMKITEVSLKPQTRHALRVSAACAWDQIFAG